VPENSPSRDLPGALRAGHPGPVDKRAGRRPFSIPHPEPLNTGSLVPESSLAPDPRPGTRSGSLPPEDSPPLVWITQFQFVYLRHRNPLNPKNMEQQLIKKITGGLFGMKMGTKEPKEVAVLLNKLKPINPYMYEEMFNKYKDLVIKTN
jgi:hypothetical protein